MFAKIIFCKLRSVYPKRHKSNEIEIGKLRHLQIYEINLCRFK